MVVTDRLNKYQEEINAICHRNNVCFIGTNSFGLCTRIFCDFGESFTVLDIDDSEPGQVLVGDISNVWSLFSLSFIGYNGFGDYW